MCSAKTFFAIIFNEIKCHVNTSLGLVGGCIPCIPPWVRAWPCLPNFPTFSAGSKRRESLRPAFPTFSTELERRESLHPAFPISLHLVLALNAGKVFALLSLFPYISC